MFIIISLITIGYMFYNSAKKTQKNILLWLSIGFFLWLGLGYLFLQITDKVILQLKTPMDVFSMEWERLLLQGISAVIIIFIAYLLQDQLLTKKR